MMGLPRMSGGPGQVRAIATDLDGTIVRSDGTISQRTKAAVSAAEQAGLLVILTSARGPQGVLAVADALGTRGKAICSNGATVVDVATRKPLHLHELETEFALQLIRSIRDHFPGILVAVERELFAHEPGFAAWNWEPPAGTPVAPVERLLEQPPTKLILRHEQHSLEAIAAVASEFAGDLASIWISGEWVVEITPPGVSKAAALAELSNEQGIAPAETVAFGDERNDIPMLAWAGHAVAVENAHPDVIAVADEVTASNDDDGVAIIIERLLRSQGPDARGSHEPGQGSRGKGPRHD